MTPPSSPTHTLAKAKADSSKRSPPVVVPRQQQQQQLSLTTLPVELQINCVTYLRANDLVPLQQTCRYFQNPLLIHKIVQHTAEHVYPVSLTTGFDQQPAGNSSGSSPYKSPKKESSFHGRTATIAQDIEPENCYTLEHLRNMELLVVARVLSRPEPTTGFFVSKSWCKTALQWLEVQQEPQHAVVQTPFKRKMSKKKQRLRHRRLSVASPPWSNVNSDLLCEHSNLAAVSNGKSARARRRLLDKQAWKILKKLYPDSTQLESVQGECLQCTLEAETARKNERDLVEQLKLERKRPLANQDVRRFYTRTRGLPVQCLVDFSNNSNNDSKEDDHADSKPAATGKCPLVPGKYYLLPRAWCHGWRRYVKTGEGGQQQHHCNSFPAPDAASLLCDAHRLPLLPPHLEAFLYGQSRQLLVASGTTAGESGEMHTAGTAAATLSPQRALVPGQAPDMETLNALRAAGLSESEVSSQLAAMRSLEVRSQQHQYQQQQQQQQQQQAAATAAATSPLHTKNELLDRENHSVVELLSECEFRALEQSWPAAAAVFCMAIVVDEATGRATCSTPPCSECDASGHSNCSMIVRNRAARSWVKKSGDAIRAPASLEY